MKICDAILEYKQYLVVEKGLSQNTIENYLRDISHFQKYIEKEFEIYHIEKIERDHIYQYLKQHDKVTAYLVSPSILAF